MSILCVYGIRLRRYIWRFIAPCLCLFSAGLISASGQENISREFQIKAVFLYNFSEFVEWPAHAYDSLESEMVIGVLGKDPFGPFLDQLAAGEFRNGHALVIRRYQSPDQINKCHILFISVEDKQKLKSALAAMKGRPILTVSDMDGFIQEGGMVRFYNADGRIRFQINATPVRQANLVISSKLLRLAEVVTDEID